MSGHRYRLPCSSNANVADEVKILDRYMVTELSGPFFFGLSAFTLIFAATALLNVSRLIAAEHAPPWAAIEYFLWQLPYIVVTVVPMAMLLGVLLALGRLSGESEITALKAGGIGLVRAVAPLLIVGLVVSIVAYGLAEYVVPFAQDRATYLRDEVIKRGGLGGSNLTLQSASPAGGRQLISAQGYDASTQSLRRATVIEYDASGRPKLVIFSERAKYDPASPTSWAFYNADWYRFSGEETFHQFQPVGTVDIGLRPTQVMRRAGLSPEELSRAQIRELVASGQLSTPEMRRYQTSYEEKLARPFASFVFTLIALPFGLRPTRGGTGTGFGLSVAIVFVYFVIASISSAIATASPGGISVSTVGAWLPNVLFTAIGAARLQRAAGV